MVRVDWETGVAYASDVPNIPKPKRPTLDNLDAKTADLKASQYTEALREWYKKIKTLSKTHSLQVPVPDYTGQKTCGIVVHFLPCDQVKVTTSCSRYDYPDYPIKEPLRMKEPKVCPK
ncbi:DUF3304 domain-containing protein [Erwinia rhapontici]|uniref:DUF3304 domain-containing protein n=1 Tax=Erwinia rhapontici TaxID=55212 RepID=UPI00389912C2